MGATLCRAGCMPDTTELHRQVRTMATMACSSIAHACQANIFDMHTPLCSSGRCVDCSIVLIHNSLHIAPVKWLLEMSRFVRLRKPESVSVLGPFVPQMSGRLPVSSLLLSCRICMLCKTHSDQMSGSMPAAENWTVTHVETPPYQEPALAESWSSFLRRA